jgi:hypothetical protein
MRSDELELEDAIDMEEGRVPIEDDEFDSADDKSHGSVDTASEGEALEFGESFDARASFRSSSKDEDCC